MKKLKKRVSFIAFLLALILFIGAATMILTPIRNDLGANWGGFLEEEPNTIDVMFLGSSLAYCNIIPAVIYEEAGLSSYVLSGPVQTPALTYYYVREMYKTQSPALICLELSGLFYPKYGKFNKDNVAYMPWSLNRLKATFTSTERAQWLDLLFPLNNYHDRWESLTPEDFTGYTADDFAGYTLLTDVISPEGLEETVREVTLTEEEYGENLYYLELILTLCRENASQVVLYSAPTHAQYDATYRALLEDQARLLAQTENVTYWDFSDAGSIPDLVAEWDFYNATHLNIRGAEKFSSHIAGLVTEFTVKQKNLDSSLWDERVQYFEDLKKQIK